MATLLSSLIIVLAYLLINVSEAKIDTLCYGRPTYITKQEEPYTCRLWQPNWASETVFELHFHHCQKLPTVSLFIRNFYGYDEINTYLNPKYKSFKTRLYTGVLARIDLNFKVHKADKKRNIRPSVHVRVFVIPDHKFSPEKRFMLLGVFYTDMKDDCSFFDLMELHTKIIIGLVSIAVLIIIPIVVMLCRKWRKTRGTGEKKKPFCVWFFKCDQTKAAENIARDGYIMNEMNGGAATDRLIYQ